jgi:hypothetical protein
LNSKEIIFKKRIEHSEVNTANTYIDTPRENKNEIHRKLPDLEFQPEK